MAAAGVINIITRKPGDQEVRLSLGGGTHDRKEGSFWVSVPGKKLNSSIWFSHRQEDESPLLQYLNSSEIFEDKNLDYENDSGGFSLNSGPVDFSATWGEYSSEWTYLGFNQKQENDYNRFSLSWKGRESRFIIYREKQEKDLAQDSEYGMSKTEVKDTSWGAEYSRQEFFEKFLMSWGIAYRNEDMQYFYPDLYFPKNFNRKRNNYAPFVEFSVPVGEMIVDTGLRYEFWDQDGAEDYDELIPKVSLSWQNSAGNLWYLSAGRFFAMPSLYELSEFYPPAEGPNVSLKPEKGWSYEFGLKGGSFKRQWSVGLFYMDMEDKITWSDGFYTNISEFRSWGIETSRTFRLSDNWDFLLGATWMNAEEKDDTSSDWLKGGSPTWDIDATMAYDRGPLSGEFSVNYLGDREDQREGMGQRSQGDVTTVDARLSYTTGGGTLRLEGYNIFDKEYFVQDSKSFGTRYYGPEARFYVTWDYQF
jgi:iron complex outermembrane receptor protein/vitamin B12 transporter